MKRILVAVILIGSWLIWRAVPVVPPYIEWVESSASMFMVPMGAVGTCLLSNGAGELKFGPCPAPVTNVVCSDGGITWSVR